MTKKQLNLQKTQNGLVENSLWKVGDKLQYKKRKTSDPVEVTVCNEAYNSFTGDAMAFFEEFSGAYSIDPIFVQYPKEKTK